MKAAGFVAQESGLDRHAHVPACVAPLCKRSPETYGNCAHWGKRQHALRPSRTQSARTQRAQVELWVACGDTEWSVPSEACLLVAFDWSALILSPHTHCGCSREPDCGVGPGRKLSCRVIQYCVQWDIGHRHWHASANYAHASGYLRSPPRIVLCNH